MAAFGSPCARRARGRAGTRHPPRAGARGAPPRPQAPLTPADRAAALLREADAIALDCDGVLVDVSGSYGRATAITVGRLLGILGVPARLRADAALAEAFKATGGFNDEVDLACALALCAAAAHASGRGAREVAAEACASLGPSGLDGVRARLARVADVSAADRALGHPGPSSVARKEYDRAFYGGGAGAPGTIGSDTLLVDAPMLRALRRAAGRRPAVVTGRGRAAFGHAVRGPLRSEIDMERSAFLEDEPRSLAKPSPEALCRALGALGSRHALYVGDSMEDLLMARAASRAGRAVSFCGVTGTARDPAARRRMLEAAGAGATVASVAELAALAGARGPAPGR